MRKTVLAITATILIVAFIGLSYIAITQQARGAREATNSDNQVMTKSSGKSQDDEEHLAHEQESNSNSVESTGNAQNDNLNESAEISANTCEDENGQADVIPPDGRIYYPDSEEPYAYTPTHSPKEPILPIVPDESEN